MSTYRCSQCGCRIEVAEGTKIGTCPACQAVFVLPNQFAQKENLYLLASDARHSGNYDMAMNYYGRILKVDGAEPEANWGYLLSKYGVEISESALDYGGVLFHPVEHSSFLKDPAYEKMMTYVPKAARHYYEGTARDIDLQHRKLMAVSKAMEAPDICIDCTAAPGSEDYLLSVQIGKALEDAGYRIFHPAMLANVDRRDLNIYEMAAAEKAEAMLVVMTPKTDREDARFQAVWRRFLAYRRQDAGRKMLSVFRGMRPEDLPLELQPLQSVACEGSDFQNRIVTEINRMFGRQNRSSDLVRKNLELLREGQEALAGGAYEKAAQRFREAAANDGEEYRAHWGLVCALTKNLETPALSDELDQSFRRALQFADKAAREKYTQSMTALMAQAAWSAFLKITGNLQDYQKETDAETKKAEERVKLYLPAFDSRFQELEDWHTGAARQRELDAVRAAYERRDTAAEPLFAEQEKLEYAYKNTALSHSKLLDDGKLRGFLLELSLIAAVASYMLLLWNFRYTTGYTTGFYKVSAWLFAASLAGIVLWAVFVADRYFRMKVLLGGAIAAVILYYFSRDHIRIFQLVLLLAPVILLLAERIMMIVLSGNERGAYEMKQKAAMAVAEMEKRIAASYQTAMEKVYAKYKLPKGEIPPFTVSHSEHYSGISGYKKPASPLSYAVRTLAFFAVLIGAVTAVNNFMYASGWNHITKVSCRYYHVVGLKEDGTAKANGWNDAGQCEVSDWENLVDVGAGRYYSAGLTSDGRVLIAGLEGQDESIREAEAWTDIQAISVGGYHIVGLKSDGTVVSAGANEWGENEVSDWSGVIQIQAVSDNNLEQTYGLCSDGRVLIAGGGSDYDSIKRYVNDHYGPGEGQIYGTELYGFTASIMVRAQDGSLNGIGNDGYKQLSQAQEWNGPEITKLCTSSGAATLGLKADGTVLCGGNNLVIRDAVSGWTDITDITVATGFAMGLKSDGTVVAAGSNGSNQLAVEDWKHIASISAGDLNSYGIQENGKVEAAGNALAGLTYLKARSPLGVLRFWYSALKW